MKRALLGESVSVRVSTSAAPVGAMEAILLFVDLFSGYPGEGSIPPWA